MDGRTVRQTAREIDILAFKVLYMVMCYFHSYSFINTFYSFIRAFVICCCSQDPMMTMTVTILWTGKGNGRNASIVLHRLIPLILIIVCIALGLMLPFLISMDLFRIRERSSA